MISAALLMRKRFSRLSVKRVRIEDADIIGVGAVLEHVSDGSAGRIIGAGCCIRSGCCPSGRSRVPRVARPWSGGVALGDLDCSLTNELVNVVALLFQWGYDPERDHRVGCCRNDDEGVEDLVVSEQGAGSGRHAA